MATMDASVVGIEAYLDPTPRAALNGRIKNQPQDFVVQEITIDGTVLTLNEGDPETFRVPTREELEVVVEKMKLAKGNRRSKDPMVFPDPPGGWREELMRLLQKDDILTQFEQIAFDINHSSSENSVFLDAPKEFRDRIYLQICIQHCFPSLDCKVHQARATEIDEGENIDDDWPRIEVMQDGLYKKFRKAGVSHENASALLTFIRKGASHTDAVRGVQLTHDDTKEARTSLHRQISSTCSILKTRTETRAGKQCVVVGFSPHNSKKRKRSEQSPEPYVRFVLQKTNLEHFTCFDRLARQLKVPQSAFATAGTKDKVAVTYQSVTVQGVTPGRILQLNSSTTEDGSNIGAIRVGQVEYVQAPLNLGELTGNKFTIVVRDLPDDVCDREIQDRIDCVTAQGFINYFGFQRVGLPTSSIRPHQIGELLVAGKWEQAVKTILSISAQDPPDCAVAKAAFAENRDIEGTLKLIPHNAMQVERSVLMGLKRFGSTSWEAAIRNIPFARRTMYLHAYQSYLFNTLASYRIKMYGAQVVEGDLIREDETENVIVATSTMAKELNENLSYPLSRVVLPLPGCNVLSPSNRVGERLSELLETHETVSILESSSILKGVYRDLVEKPRQVEWSRVEDDKSAFRIRFILSSGSFATMCLREILHMSL